MRQLITTVTLALLLLLPLPVLAGPDISVDGKLATLSEEPYIKNGVTYIPLRGISEAIGAEVEWDGTLRGAWVRKDGGETMFALDDAPYATLINLRSARNVVQIGSEIRNGRMYLPLRRVSEYTGYSVEWRSGIVYLESPRVYENTGAVNRYIAAALKLGFTEPGVGGTSMRLVFPGLPDNALITDEMFETSLGIVPPAPKHAINMEQHQNRAVTETSDYTFYVYSAHRVNRTVGNTEFDIVPKKPKTSGHIRILTRDTSVSDTVHSYYREYGSTTQYFTVDPLSGPQTLMLVIPKMDYGAPTYPSYDMDGNGYVLTKTSK